MEKWQLQEAKNRFSEVVKRTLSEGPQMVTRHGIDSVVILSAEDYKRLVHPKTDIVTFFKKSPLYNVELYLSRNKGRPREVML